jgi:transposase
MKDVEEMDRGRIAAPAAGMTVRDVAEEIGISKSVVHRLKQRIEQEAEAEGRRDRGAAGVAVTMNAGGSDMPRSDISSEGA